MIPSKLATKIEKTALKGPKANEAAQIRITSPEPIPFFERKYINVMTPRTTTAVIKSLIQVPLDHTRKKPPIRINREFQSDMVSVSKSVKKTTNKDAPMIQDPIIDKISSKTKKFTVNMRAVSISTKGYRIAILLPQSRHLPFRMIKLKMGILS